VPVPLVRSLVGFRELCLHRVAPEHELASPRLPSTPLLASFSAVEIAAIRFTLPFEFLELLALSSTGLNVDVSLLMGVVQSLHPLTELRFDRCDLRSAPLASLLFSLATLVLLGLLAPGSSAAAGKPASRRGHDWERDEERGRQTGRQADTGESNHSYVRALCRMLWGHPISV
jgi:hypothetical protein